MSKLKKNIVFVVAVIISIAIIIYGSICSNQIASVSGKLMQWVSNKFGWFYVLAVSGFCIFLAWMAFGKYGKVKLGKEDDKPEYSNFHWYAMLFCGGTGIGLVFWSIAEPLSHYVNPPQGITPGTQETVDFTVRTSFLHWGITQWVCFAIVGLGIAYFQYRKNKNAQISGLLSPLVGEKATNGVFGNLIDIFSVVVSVAGIATSLGLGVKQISGGLNFLFGIDNGKLTYFIIIIVITIIFLASAISGVNKGIKFLSSVNTVIAFALLGIAFIIGPHIPILNNMVNGIGQHIQNFFGDVFSISDDSWYMDWRVFYYAWFIAWTPFVGMFIARISKGRTIREFLFGAIIVPTIFTIIWLSVFGTIALNATEGWSLDAIRNLVASPETAVFIVFNKYPLSKVITVLIICLLSIFFITSADSATYSLSVMTSNGDINPPKYKRVVWAVISATIAFLLLAAGSLKPLQTISIAASLPFLFIMIAMCPAILKDLKYNGK